MRLTGFDHSCVLVEIDDARILFDPGNFSSGFDDLTGLDAICITHAHPDHCDIRVLPTLLAHNPDAALYADPQTAAKLNSEAGLGVWKAAVSGSQFTIKSVPVRVTGGEHAVIYPEIPVIANSGFLVGATDTGAAFLHPGDSLFVPPERVEVLALPVAAPWAKISETIDFQRAVSPRVSVPIHDAVLSNAGKSIYHARLAELAPAGTEFTKLLPGEPISIDESR